ncbi:MAG: type IX secretion system membrane protein PorP/SprF [Flavobacteriales bacterium]|nr:type IX secretion system membrane protein PorP/SprF [Flavobacteriales bacterium]MCB9447413.1 type IX secretion system membrane protein PorP/SprF [Flavobacteriales bacterium]
MRQGGMKPGVWIGALLLLALPFMGRGQQLPVFSHYMFNRVLLNPAVAGSDPFINIQLNHRSQWVGFEDAPVTQVLSGHGVLPNGKMGVGGYMFNDAAGPFHRIGLNLAYAYHLQLGEVNLVMGLSGGLLQYSVDGRQMELYDATDQLIDLNTRDKDITPDANFGMYLYNDKLHVGISALHLLEGRLQFFNGKPLPASIPLENHYYLMAGYEIDTRGKLKVEPSLLVHAVKANPVQVHVNTNLLFDEKIYAGISYRTGDAVVLLAGAVIKEHFKVIYSYDFLYSSLRSSNSGSHEITLAYSLAYKSGDGPLKRRYKLNRVHVN